MRKACCSGRGIGTPGGGGTAPLRLGDAVHVDAREGAPARGDALVTGDEAGLGGELGSVLLGTG